ncbi:MAG: gliding motility protein GldL [Bacteroidales bacterium]|nr:gliding motility protein GldL [Bacteroidales bacterium]
MKLREIVQTSGWKNFMAKLYGWGASVVIIGALFKIQHYPGAGLMLILGLSTEAIIFFFSAFEPPHEEPDWTLVYPELAGLSDEDELELPSGRRSGGGYGGSGSALEKFDKMLEEGEITPDLFNKLGQGLNKLSQTADKLNDISDAAVATNKYSESMVKAAETVDKHTENYVSSTEELKSSVDHLSESYDKTANLISESGTNYQRLAESFSHIEDGSKSYNNNLETLNKNLSALNAVYELQLQTSNEQLKKAEDTYSGLAQIMEDLKASAESSSKYREEVTKLSENLSELNTIYGNMLAAMNVMRK